jgi:hypothetical protein
MGNKGSRNWECGMRKIKAQGLKKIPQTTDNTQQTQRRWETREVGIGNAECGKLKLKAEGLKDNS